MIAARFQSPQEWLAERNAARERQARGERRTEWVAKGVLLAAFVGLIGTAAFQHFHTTPQVLIEGKPVAKSRGDDKLWNEWWQAAWTAGQKWGAELNTPPLRFNLIADPSFCGSKDAIACASAESQTVWVSQVGADVDRTTIMMHEIGHLLGIPHIEDDPLMAPNYQGLLDRPSPQAIAIAKSRMSPGHLDIWPNIQK